MLIWWIFTISVPMHSMPNFLSLFLSLSILFFFSFFSFFSTWQVAKLTVQQELSRRYRTWLEPELSSLETSSCFSCARDGCNMRSIHTGVEFNRGTPDRSMGRLVECPFSTAIPVSQVDRVTGTHKCRGLAGTSILQAFYFPLSTFNALTWFIE